MMGEKLRLLKATKCVRPNGNWLLVIVAVIELLNSSVGSASPLDRDAGRSWTTRDSIAVRYVSLSQDEPRIWVVADAYREPLKFSPDGKYVFFVTHWGELSSDSNMYELQVFRLTDIESELGHRGSSKSESIPPFRSARFRTFSSEDPGIKGAVWSEDADSVLFLGVPHDIVNSGNNRDMQPYSLDMKSGEAKQVTRHSGLVESFNYQNGGLIFNDEFLQDAATRMPTYPMEAMLKEDVVGSVSRSRWPVNLLDTRSFVSYQNSQPKVLPGYITGVNISGDGKRAFVRQVVPLPYDLRYVMVDVEHGVVRPEISAWPPNPRVEAPYFKTLWTKDGRHAVLVNVALKRTDEGGAPTDDSEAVIADYDTVTGHWRVIEPLSKSVGGRKRNVVSVDWLAGDRNLIVTHQMDGQATLSTIYSMTDIGWIGRDVHSVVTTRPSASRYLSAHGVSIALRQSANDPPIVVARSHNREIPLQPPDHALDGVWRSPMELYRFNDKNGKGLTGGLMLPRGFKKGVPAPLVIQTYDFSPELFLPDGPNSTAFAAQSLVSRGFAVIQLDTTTVIHKQPDSENVAFSELIQSAIDSLVEEKIADERKVGVIGFSHTGFDTYYVVTHPGRVPLAAAVCADSYTGSYSRYLLASAYTGHEGEEEEYDYGGPFWTNKAEWLEKEPTFNVDRVRTPVLFSLIGSGSIPGSPGYREVSFETIGAFLANRKPFEYLFFPEGAHELQRPRERIAMLDSVVDWMSFWLQGREEADPEKAAEYARWRPLRELQKAFDH